MHIESSVSGRLTLKAWNRGVGGRYLESIALAKRILEEDPDGFWAWNIIGNAYQSMSDCSESAHRSAEYSRLAAEAWQRARSALVLEN